MRQLDLCKGIQSKEGYSGDLGVAKLRDGLELLEQLLSKCGLILLLKKREKSVFPFKALRK